jgi:hypothetical protein
MIEEREREGLNRDVRKKRDTKRERGLILRER